MKLHGIHWMLKRIDFANRDHRSTHWLLNIYTKLLMYPCDLKLWNKFFEFWIQMRCEFWFKFILIEATFSVSLCISDFTPILGTVHVTPVWMMSSRAWLRSDMSDVNQYFRFGLVGHEFCDNIQSLIVNTIDILFTTQIHQIGFIGHFIQMFLIILPNIMFEVPFWFGIDMFKCSNLASCHTNIIW